MYPFSCMTNPIVIPSAVRNLIRLLIYGDLLRKAPWSLLRSPAVVCNQADMNELVKLRYNGQIKKMYLASRGVMGYVEASLRSKRFQRASKLFSGFWNNMVS